MAALPTFISIPEAAHQLGVSEASLRHMIESGSIKAANVSGETIVSEASVRKYHRQQPITQPSGINKDDLPGYKKYSDLSGHGISIAGASRKYFINFSTLRRWVQRGFVHVIGTDKNKTLLDEQDVAFCGDIYKNNPGQGRWLFRSDGTPYVAQTEKVQASS
jgi:excisionase family DNA binding protein